MIRLKIEKMNSKWLKRLFFIALIIGVIVIIRMTLLAPDPIPISVYRVSPGRVEATVSNSKAGTIKVRKRANLSPEVGGRVVYVGAREGERVKAGDLLLRLEDSEYKASLRLAERAWRAAVAAEKEACLDADLANRELERNRKLKEQGIVSESLLDQLGNKRDAARARCEASRAEARRVEASVEVAKANWQKTQLYAPFDGIVVQVTTEVGEWVTPSPPGVPIPPVIDILDDKSIYVEAPIDETDAGKLRSGLPLRISLDPYPDQTFKGKLTRIAPFVRDIEGQNRTVDVEAEFEDKKFAETLLPGTSADIEVILESRENVLRIPTYALMEGNQVLLVENNVLVARYVKTGLRNWEYVEIQGGLKSGDQIAVSLDRAEVKEGALVEVTEEVNK